LITKIQELRSWQAKNRVCGV